MKDWFLLANSLSSFRNQWNHWHTFSICEISLW